MGLDTLDRSECTDTPLTDLGLTTVRAQNSGRCVESVHSGVSLNLGAGRCRWPDWISVDLDGADVCSDLRTLPYAEGSVDRVAAIHVLEHFYEWEALPLITEWQRVLKPGGVMILELPCMDKVLSYLVRCVRESVPANLAFSWWVFWGNPAYHSPAMCHKWGYTIDSVQALLRQAGFVEIQMERPRYHFAERDMRITGRKP